MFNELWAFYFDKFLGRGPSVFYNKNRIENIFNDSMLQNCTFK
jgi:hypothetical protein